MTLRSHDWHSRFLRLALLEGREKVEAVSTELRTISKPQNLVAMFDEFLEETRSGVDFQGNSYTHDNGFDKIVIFDDSETRMKMRLHIWHPVLPSDVRRVRQNVHNHRWDFSSIVLLGRMDHLTYRFAGLAEKGEELFHYRYYARGSKDHYDLEELGKSSVIEVHQESFKSGQLYCVGNLTLHRVDVEDQMTAATLVITHENVGWVTNDLLSEKSIGSQGLRLSSPAMIREIVEMKVVSLRHILEI